jgi:hypothetical protein
MFPGTRLIEHFRRTGLTREGKNVAGWQNCAHVVCRILRNYALSPAPMVPPLVMLPGSAAIWYFGFNDFQEISCVFFLEILSAGASCARNQSNS